jgi:hypothetical protein
MNTTYQLAALVAHHAHHVAEPRLQQQLGIKMTGGEGMAFIVILIVAVLLFGFKALGRAGR